MCSAADRVAAGRRIPVEQQVKNIGGNLPAQGGRGTGIPSSEHRFHYEVRTRHGRRSRLLTASSGLRDPY